MVTLQKAVTDGRGQFLGVVRVGLLAQELDALVHQGAIAPHMTFLCDGQGRLVTRTALGDPLRAFGDQLRVVPTQLAVDWDDIGGRTLGAGDENPDDEWKGAHGSFGSCDGSGRLRSRA
jgi:hypothetical protein